MIPRAHGRAGEPLTITGTAYDLGRRVAAVEFSLNGGRTWTRRETPGTNDYQNLSWSFTWTPPAPGSYELLVRAVSEDGRHGPEPDSVELCIAE